MSPPPVDIVIALLVFALAAQKLDGLRRSTPPCFSACCGLLAFILDGWYSFSLLLVGFTLGYLYFREGNLTCTRREYLGDLEKFRGRRVVVIALSSGVDEQNDLRHGVRIKEEILPAGNR